jgi:hypothetical protein
VYLALWNHELHRGLASVNDLGVAEIQENAELEDLASVLGDAAIAEVWPE